MRYFLLALWIMAAFLPYLWFMSAVVLIVERRAAHWTARACYHELRPFFWPAATFACLYDPDYGRFGGTPAVALLQLAMYGIAWWLGRNAGDDDDRWRRRRRRLAERVSEVGGRLTVVPAGAET